MHKSYGRRLAFKANLHQPLRDFSDNHGSTIPCPTTYYVNRAKSSMDNAKGLRKNKFAELALRFGSDLADPIEQNPMNSELFRGV
jgi:hypothetical protein